MAKTTTERLREYLAQLPPKAQALLMREFERAIERGEDAAVATLVLEELRRVARSPTDDLTARAEDPARLVFRPLDPFLVDGNAAIRPGQIRRASLLPVWQWLCRDGAPDAARAFLAALAQPDEAASASERNRPINDFQAVVAETIDRAITGGGDSRRALARLGSPQAIEDLPAIGAVLKAREALDTLNGRLPATLRAFGDSQIASVNGALNNPVLQSRPVLPFALSLVIARLVAPWQVIRLAIAAAASDDEIRVAATPFGVAVTMAIHDLVQIAGGLRADIKRGNFTDVPDGLKTVHDGVRGLRTELDIRNDSAWGRQLAAIRVNISNAFQVEIDSVPGRVRRLLRQRPDKDISATSRLDPIDIDETAALIDFVAVCRTYASELAINEVTLRTFSDLQHYLEPTTEALVEALRGADSRTLPFRQMQAKAAIRFCEVLFGRDYAALMERAAESAVNGERKSARAG
ncbi:MAG: hypothetical protein J0H25_01190 [Rhizobiales bacterium]|nr:hypothetical protein [Hyphomicrobiales bacterium]